MRRGLVSCVRFVSSDMEKRNRVCLDRRFSVVLVCRVLFYAASISLIKESDRSAFYSRWADVPTTQHSELFVASSGCAHASPTVKYRGIFLNDEQPALQNWAMEKFTNGTGAALTGSPFNHFFYTKL